MRKIINNAEHVVDEMMEGYISAYSRYYVKHPDVNGVILKQRRKDKVALVIGGGSGHEPMFSGFVGKGLADAAACGNIFASPDPNTIYQTAKAVEQGKGVLFVYGCYAGDNLNFDMGEEFLNDDGIQTAHVRVWDDVASAPQERIEDRRGIAGDVFVVKIAGAACDAGLELEEVVRVTEKARDNTRTIGVATAPAQLPGVEQPIFTLGEGEIEYGMGLHGERGVLRTTWEDADVLTEKMYKQILDDSDLKTGDEVCVLVNGLGSTTITELAIVFRKVKKLLDADGIKVYDTDLNNYCTSQEMGGFSITLFKLDEELKKYYDILKVKEYAEQGYTFAVVLDLSKYFDTLNHEILINLLRKNVKDERVVQLIKRYLKSGVMENGEIRIRPTIPDEWSCYRLEKIKCQEKELSIIYDKTGEKYHREKGFQVWCNGECIHKSLYPEEIKVAR